MGTSTYYLNLEDGWDLTVRPGSFVTAEGDRNGGPAIWLDDPLGGAIAVASDREKMITTLEAMLEKARTMPDPLPPSTCTHCGGEILLVPADHEAMNALRGRRLWAHYTGSASELKPWSVACDVAGPYQATPST